MTIAAIVAELRQFNHFAAAKALESLAAKYECERHCNLSNTAELHRADALLGELREKAEKWDAQEKSAAEHRAQVDATFDKILGTLKDAPPLPEVEFTAEELAAIFGPCEQCGESFCDCCHGCIQLRKDVARLTRENWQLRRVEEADCDAMAHVVRSMTTHDSNTHHPLSIDRLQKRIDDADRKPVPTPEKAL